MVARLSLLQLFLAFAVARARNDPPPSCERRHSRRSQVQNRGGYAPLAIFDHASRHSSDQSLAGLIKGAVNLIHYRAEKNLNVL